jgi:DNA-binding response OmpR family regulator
MTHLAGKRILVVEDEALVAMFVEDILFELSAEVIGPALSMERALAVAATEQIDAALLDVNIRGSPIDPVADLLRSRGVPMVFATGYGHSASVRVRGLPIVEKPYTRDLICNALLRALGVST